MNEAIRPAVMIGQTLSHYRIVEKLGEGGMGVVYRAQDTRLNRLVALKILPADAVADPERKKRFVQEARTASALNHPNIVTVHDIGNEGGLDFIAMEYVWRRPTTRASVARDKIAFNLAGITGNIWIARLEPAK